VGVALVAAVGLGLYPDFESLKQVVRVERAFEPNEANAETYDFLFQTYQEVYSSLKKVYRRLNKERFQRSPRAEAQG